MTSFKITENLSLKKEMTISFPFPAQKTGTRYGGESGKNQPISPQSSPFSPTESYTFKLKKLSQLFQASSKSQHNMNFIRRGPALIYSLFPQIALHLIFTFIFTTPFLQASGFRNFLCISQLPFHSLHTSPSLFFVTITPCISPS